jgi:hypothetical protein
MYALRSRAVRSFCGLRLRWWYVPRHPMVRLPTLSGNAKLPLGSDDLELPDRG